MRKIDSTDVPDEIQIALYYDCDEGLHVLPRADVEFFTDRVYDPFPERKNGRYGATVVLGTSKDWTADPTLERRAIQKAKHLIGLPRQKVALEKRKQGNTYDKGRTTERGRTQDRSGMERPTGATVPAETSHH